MTLNTLIRKVSFLILKQPLKACLPSARPCQMAGPRKSGDSFSLQKQFLEAALIFCLSVMVLLTGCRKASPAKSSSVDKNSTADEVLNTNTNSRTNEPSEALARIMSRRGSWNPVFTSYYGKEMPDFKVKDIKGTMHSLSDYRGKDVLVIMWATWCMPCVQEIPHLVALREIMPADKLAILAISKEPANVVKAMAETKNMTYTVISHQGLLPEPLSSVKSIPSGFFIRPDGTLKIATEGSLYLGELKSIILAE